MVSDTESELTQAPASADSATATDSLTSTQILADDALRWLTNKIREYIREERWGDVGINLTFENGNVKQVRQRSEETRKPVSAPRDMRDVLTPPAAAR